MCLKMTEKSALVLYAERDGAREAINIPLSEEQYELVAALLGINVSLWQRNTLVAVSMYDSETLKRISKKIGIPDCAEKDAKKIDCIEAKQLRNKAGGE